MILYNELTIENGLYIDMQVESLSYYDNINIIGVRIDTADTYNTEYPYKKIMQEEAKSMEVSLNVPVKNELFIITPIISGYPSEDTPCCKDKIDIAYIYCDYEIKKHGLSYINELGLNCEMPKNFIDFIFRYIAFQTALDAESYNDAVKYWKLLHNNKFKTGFKNCGCHG